MSGGPARSWLSRARYALPGLAGGLVPAKTARSAAATCKGLHAQGFAVTTGHFPGPEEPVAAVAAANLAAIEALGATPCVFYLSVKAPQLAFLRPETLAIAAAANDAGGSLLFDAHGPQLADRTFALFEEVLADHPGTGCALPARWRRSQRDARRLAAGSARLRLVRGEWSDGSVAEGDVAGAYLDLVGRLAGRSAPVAVATHDPVLAERALTVLRAAGTPCELEQLRGLPTRRTRAIARNLGVPVRIYVPFGAGWIPYAADQALARPHLPLWMLRDRFGLADPA